MGEQFRVTGNIGPPPVGPVAGPGGVPLQEVQQHGSIGDFLGSTLEGLESGFIRCVYTAKNHSANTVTLLCEKLEGCCQTGCCPKDQFWMTGLMILLIFVLVLFCVGTIIMIICYQRSKIQQRRAEKEIYEATRGPTAAGTEMAQHGGGVYARPVYGPAMPQQQQHHHHYATATMPTGNYGNANGGNLTASRRF